MRILGIDYGSKRVGIAISDPEARFALPHSVISNSSSDAARKALIKEICSIARRDEIRTIVIGESRDYHGRPNKIQSGATDIARGLIERGFVVESEPEFMTSMQAERFQGKHDLSDASAAALILQSYLDTKKNKR
jgi:putative holliday junction resolvase